MGGRLGRWCGRGIDRHRRLQVGAAAGATGPVETEDPSSRKGLREFPYLAGGPARIWHLADSTPVGCRGFNGPVPPPLLIRALQLCADRTGRGRAVSTRPKVRSAIRMAPWTRRPSCGSGSTPTTGATGSSTLRSSPDAVTEVIARSEVSTDPLESQEGARAFGQRSPTCTSRSTTWSSLNRLSSSSGEQPARTRPIRRRRADRPHLHPPRRRRGRGPRRPHHGIPRLLRPGHDALADRADGSHLGEEGLQRKHLRPGRTSRCFHSYRTPLEHARLPRGPRARAPSN